MLKNKKYKSDILASIRKQNLYFQENNRDIAVRNAKILKTVAYVTMVLFLMFSYISAFIYPKEPVAAPFYLILPVLFLFLFLVYRAERSEYIGNRITNYATWMHIVNMILIVGVSICGSLHKPSAFYPLYLLMGPVLFYIPFVRLIAINTISFLIFMPLVLILKDAAVINHEIYESATALVLSYVCIGVMLQMRVQTNDMQEKYREMSLTDSLTGVKNKGAALVLGQEYIYGMEESDRAALLFIDIDDFKSINDIHGHLTGDEILKDVARILKSSCRDQDIVSRFGGDEFFILLKGVNKESVIKERAESIVAGFHEMGKRHGFDVTCSIGIYCFSGGDIQIDDCIQKADEALYHVKNNGKNDYYIL
ncbi:MAG: GGDEF domain-containing protein [Lachnospiraceae bacterium]|nr:GGDEF domain-containing protein [Lachnospiraceae bacterium]